MHSMAALCALEVSEDGAGRIDAVKFHRLVQRRSRYQMLVLVAGLDREGAFAERGTRTADGVADLLGLSQREGRRLVSVAASVLPTSLAGEPLEPKLPATAMALGAFEIDQAHVEVIDRVLNSDAAGRIDPVDWASLEVQLADLARLHGPDSLARQAWGLLELLDQDG
ncbi:MAG: hypothetical protein QOI68_3642, partial [Pseudonocardiales bacterium]|nr:hypothetical protein [Pseudonocardiales bacterium]